ncbi:hypothetical protein E3A20_22780 [Planctomyces bekefii]|uniref:Sulfatase n=1 Tax=Planctomyces bekefii TaxID=1653850 RepID=A0A5C6M393_9PLAN|nr:hypothetical protein E3A20_22780 [Planctomyces bekefii]
MAGGGVKAGTVYGETCEFGYNVATDGVHIHDLQATVLHLLGIDHERLTYYHNGIQRRLTNVHGEVVGGAAELRCRIRVFGCSFADFRGLF